MDTSKNNKNIDVQKIMKRALIKKDIKDSIEQTLDQRIERYLEIGHQGIMGIIILPLTWGAGTLITFGLRTLEPAQT
jgi:hypothetical protein